MSENERKSLARTEIPANGAPPKVSVVFRDGDEYLLSSELPELTGGDSLGGYKIVKILGFGGMGVVYLARQVSMGRLVALKVLRKSLSGNVSSMERFQREIRNLANITHPNIVSAIEAGYDRELVFLAMTYAPGDDLKKLLNDRGRLPEKEAFRVGLALCRALKYAWEKYNIVHRDIKPANVMISTDGEVKLMDLGISKRTEEGEMDVTRAGMMIGSPLYISPEQARGQKNVDFHSDMYSLAATIYHALTGTPPFLADTSVAVISMHLTEPVPDPREICPHVTPEAYPIFIRAMAKRPEDRYPNWDSLIETIEDHIEALEKTKPDTTTRVVGDAPSPSPPPPTAAKKSTLAERWPKKRRVRVAVLGLLLLVDLVLFVLTVAKSVEKVRQDRAAAVYAEAEPLVDAVPAVWDNLQKARGLLGKVIRIGDPFYAARARETLVNLEKKEKAFEETQRNDEILFDLRSLERRSRELEAHQRYRAAFVLWLQYRKNGRFANELSAEIDKNIDYLRKRHRDEIRGFN